MQPDETLDNDIDFEDDAPFEAEDWDEEALGLDGVDLDAESIAREIGVRP